MIHYLTVTQEEIGALCGAKLPQRVIPPATLDPRQVTCERCTAMIRAIASAALREELDRRRRREERLVSWGINFLVSVAGALVFYVPTSPFVSSFLGTLIGWSIAALSTSPLRRRGP